MEFFSYRYFLLQSAQLTLGKSMSNNPLGQPTCYPEHYDPSYLFAIPRQNKRDELGLPATLPFQGVDLWSVYELSWLNLKGKPIIATALITVPCTSPYLFESKSLKLYLNSFNQSRFKSAEELRELIQADLSAITQGKVKVKFCLAADFAKQQLAELPGVCIDDLDLEIDTYEIDSDFLSANTNIVQETLKSNLLKSNCLITNQPDWGSVMIRYAGPQINHEGLLKYLISFRKHNEFHEQCVERIFYDILQRCNPKHLTVYARYTRRGGIDINPFRSNCEIEAPNYRNFRQ